jgi:hypothetical protein
VLILQRNGLLNYIDCPEENGLIMKQQENHTFSRKIKERFFIEQMENILILYQFP